MKIIDEHGVVMAHTVGNLAPVSYGRYDVEKFSYRVNDEIYGELLLEYVQIVNSSRCVEVALYLPRKHEKALRGVSRTRVSMV